MKRERAKAGETDVLPGVEKVASADQIAEVAGDKPALEGQVVVAPGRRRPKVADVKAVLLHIHDGLSVRAACRLVGVNHSHTVEMLNEPRWRDQYAQARQERGVVFGEKVIAVSDAALRGFIQDDTGQRYVVDPRACAVAMSGYQWAAERMAPKLVGPSVLKVPAAVGENDQWNLHIHDD